MNEDHFDRIARRLSGAFTRRGIVAGISGVLLTRATPASAASQIETAACGEAGAVCTQIKGCCSGLVCATSYTNPAYGVCVTGEGDMLAVSDDIVVPGAEGIEDELALEVTDVTSSATDAESSLDARATEMQSRQDARRTRVQSHRTSVRSRKATHRLNSGTGNDLIDLDERPRLQLKWINNADGEGNPADTEILRVYNRDIVSVEISRIESVLDQRIDFDFDLPITLSINQKFDLLSNASDIETDQELSWTQEDICRPAAENDGGGIYLTVKRTGGTRSRQLTVLCHEPLGTKSAVAAASQPGKKTRKKHRGQKPSKRGKGR